MKNRDSKTNDGTVSVLKGRFPLFYSGTLYYDLFQNLVSLGDPEMCKGRKSHPRIFIFPFLLRFDFESDKGNIRVLSLTNPRRDKL